MELFSKSSLYSTNTTRAQEPKRPATARTSGSTARAESKDVSGVIAALELYRDGKDVPAAFTAKPVDAAYPYSYQTIKNQQNASKAELAWTGLNLFVSRLWPVELARMSISTTARDHRYEKYLTLSQKAMAAKGYRLFINPVIAGDLNAFSRQNNQKRLTGAEIKKLAQRFDTQFTFMGDYGTSGIFTRLVSYEFDSVSDKQYEAKRNSLHTTKPIGGMKGGGWNSKTRQPTGAYWGITQFGAGSYAFILPYAKGWGVNLPDNRQDMTFGQMLVAAYVLAIIRQPTLVNLGIPVDPVTVYINHNQGNGVWRAAGVKKIKASAWDGQSAVVKTLLKSYGFQRA